MGDRAVIYARFSSSRQQEQSIDGQVRYCTQYAEARGYKLLGVYADRAISGTTDERPEFQRMIADAKKKKFDYVIVWKLDRFSRDRYASAMYKHELKKNGVKVLSATEGIGEGDESVILEAILEAMAEMYVKQLSQNVTRGMRESALAGKHGSGTTPYGYKLENKHLVVNPEEAEAVKYIFDQYAAGVRKVDIATQLNARGYRTRKGVSFSSGSFLSILQNKKYIGVYSWSDIEIPGGCPAIVTEDLFEKCQARIAANHRKQGRMAKVDYLLKGKLFCGHCGAPMIGDSGTGRHGGKFYYYTCSAKKNKGAKACDKHRERKGYVEWYVVEQCLEYVLQPDRLEFIAKNIVDIYNISYSKDKLENLRRRKARLEQEYEKIADSLIHATSTKMIDAVNRRAADTEAALGALDDEIAMMEVGCKVALTEEQVKAWLSQFCSGDAADESFQRRIIDVLINAVYLYDDKVVIYFNVKSGKQISYIEMQNDLDELESQSQGSETDSNSPPLIIAGSTQKVLPAIIIYPAKWVIRTRRRQCRGWRVKSLHTQTKILSVRSAQGV